MTVSRIADLTLNELRALVEAIVDERLKPRVTEEPSRRPVHEVLAEMDDLLITPEPGTPSVVEMLREDRER